MEQWEQLKRVGNIFEKICDIENIYTAIRNAARGKKHRKTVAYVLDNQEKAARLIQEMLVNKTYKPKPYSVEKCGGLAEVVLYENIAQMTRENEAGEAEKYFAYDEFRITIPYRENLDTEIKANRAAWLKVAKDIEENTAEKLSLEEQVKKFAAENAALKADSELMGTALEEVIAVVAGGE